MIDSCCDAMSFSDFPMDPSQYPQSYMRHDRVAGYLNEYTDHFALRKAIVFGSRVVECKHTADEMWRVKYVKDGKEITVTCNAVFVCTGRFVHPKVPEFPGLGSFKGDFTHSHYYRDPSKYVGKKVAVIGIGNSGSLLAM